MELLLSNYLKSVQILNMTMSIYLIAYITICVIYYRFLIQHCVMEARAIILLQLNVTIIDYYYYIYQI